MSAAQGQQRAHLVPEVNVVRVERAAEQTAKKLSVEHRVKKAHREKCVPSLSPKGVDFLNMRDLGGGVHLCQG